MMDIKCIERKLDVNIVPVWTPRTHAHIVTADLGSKMSSSTDEWCVDRDDLVKVFTKLNFLFIITKNWQPLFYPSKTTDFFTVFKTFAISLKGFYFSCKLFPTNI